VAFHTVGFRDQLDRISYPDIDDTKKPLILFLEFFLIEHLDRQNTVLVDFAVACESRCLTCGGHGVGKPHTSRNFHSNTG
jgi:hypothetical protein